MKSILQDWVQELGLRHQGVLVSSVRGCDTVQRDDPIKLLCRCLRSTMLNAHCGDPRLAKSYIEWVDSETLLQRMNSVVKSHDHLPHHYLMHLIHAAEIVGYKHPDTSVRAYWNSFYMLMVRKLHLAVETEYELGHRLNADEETFKAAQ